MIKSEIPENIIFFRKDYRPLYLTFSYQHDNGVLSYVCKYTNTSMNFFVDVSISDLYRFDEKFHFNDYYFKII